MGISAAPPSKREPNRITNPAPKMPWPSGCNKSAQAAEMPIIAAIVLEMTRSNLKSDSSITEISKIATPRKNANRIYQGIHWS
jgi:hypothetical protein